MKKKIFDGSLKRSLLITLYTILGLIFSGMSFAQESAGGGGDGLPFKYGAKVGTTISTFTNQQPHNNKITGLTAGLFANYFFNENMGVQIEGLYAQEGGRLLRFDIPELLGRQNWYGTDVENQRLVLHNINVPVLFQYILPISGIDFVGSLGPDFGYTLTAKVHKEGTVFTESGSFHTYTGSENVTSNVERLSMAATIGIGAKVPVGDFNILIDARYRYAFTSSYNSYSYVGIPQVSGDLKLNTFSLTVGIEL